MDLLPDTVSLKIFRGFIQGGKSFEQTSLVQQSILYLWSLSSSRVNSDMIFSRIIDMSRIYIEIGRSLEIEDVGAININCNSF